MSANASDIKIPEWLDEQFLERVAISAERDDGAKLIDFQIREMGNQDHVASVMFRAKITYVTSNNIEKQLSAIVKASPELDLAKKEFMGESNIFEVENSMYSKVLPKIQETVNKFDSGTPIAPRMFYQSKKPHDVLVFEDLSETGYAPVQARFPTMEEGRLVMRKLALFHAGSYNLYSQGETDITNFKNGCFNVPNVRKSEIYSTGIGHLTEQIESMPHCQKYLEPLRAIKSDKLLDKCIDTFNKLGSYNVLNHGDFHFKNIMYKQDDSGKSIDVMFIDYQLCIWGSPAIDLIYLWTDSDEKLEQYDQLIDLYFETFSDALKKMKCKGTLPTFSQLQKELELFSPIRVFFLATFLPFLAVELGESDYDFATIMMSANARKTLYSTKSFCEYVTKMLPIYFEKGYIQACK